MHKISISKKNFLTRTVTLLKWSYVMYTHIFISQVIILFLVPQISQHTFLAALQGCSALVPVVTFQPNKLNL